MKPSPEKHPNRWGVHYRRKSKKLDAICETEYKKNHVESNEVDDLTGENSELRRSSRVRRAPVVLDASPPPPRKRPRVVKDASPNIRRTAKESLVSMEKVERSDTPGGWKSRLRSRPKIASPRGGVRVPGSRRRKLFTKANASDLGEEAMGSRNVKNTGESQGEKLMKSKSLARVTVSSSSEENDSEMSGTEEGSINYIEEVVECEDVAGVEDMVNRIEPGLHISENENEAGLEDKLNKIEPGLHVSENENEAGVEDMVNKIEPRMHVSENENESGGHAMEDEAGGHATENHAVGHGMENWSKIRMEGVENGTKLDTEEAKDKKEVGPEGMENAAEMKTVKIDNETEENMQRMENEVNLRMEGMESDARLEGLENDNDGCIIVSESGNDVRNDMPPVNNGFVDQVKEETRDVSKHGKLLQGCIIVDHMTTLEESDEGLELSVQEKERENQQAVVPDRGYADNNVGEDGEAHVMREQSQKVPFESGSHAKEDKRTHPLKERLSNPCLKQGRRCGLCGGGTNGKPPKKLIEDCSESDKETHCGSSASEDPNYDAWDGFGNDPGWLGRLLGPINDRYGIAGTWVHQHCAVWSPEVYFAGLGRLKNVRAALCRGRTLKCTRCGRPGATIGCRVDRCPKTYHLPCARANSCIFDHRKFLIACTDHRHLFQPYGRQSHFRIKKLKTKRMKLEMRKHSTDAWRKDLEAEEKWLERCGEDEEFLKRESKRLHRDLLRVAPTYIGGSDCESGNLHGGWESVAGLQNVIQCMKEVVILPLLYPEFFSNLGLTPPRGVLLHGYPGTGKTLVVRALIGSLAHSEKRIAYFARKGADCLGKYVGDAERQLRLLFQVAEKCQPSIIFFDEIDGLAPQRTRQQDQTHSSVVSTLLALLDGLKSRGSVVVIGATNRPDSIDPALRRPGRFDREIYFPLPSLEDRASIISLHTKKWPKPISGSLLKRIAKNTVGFAGADLQALCTQAAIIALKRSFPLHEAMDSAELKTSGSSRVALPAFLVEERDWLEALSCSPPPCSRREAGIAASDIVSSPLPLHLVPCLLRPLCSLFVALNLEERIWLPPLLSKAAEVVENLIVSALSNKRVSDDCWWCHVDAILEETSAAKDVVRKLLKAGILKRENYMIGPDTNADDAGNDNSDCEPSVAHKVVAHSSLFGKLSLAPRNNYGFRVLVSGIPRSGQRHLAACILHCLVGNIEVHKIDLATICQEGGGDLVDGVTHLLLKCASKRSCAVFMPRIDLWALETPIPLFEDFEEGSDEGSEEGSAEDSGKLGHNGKEHDVPSGSLYGREERMQSGNAAQVSQLWSTFVEQMESMSVSMSLTVLATSSVPYKELPEKIRQYFKTDLSKGYKPMSSKTVPQFAVQVGGSFDRDLALNLSVAELSEHTIQSFISLIHQRNHSNEKIFKKYKRLSSGGQRQDKETEDKSKQPGDCSTQVVPLPISRKLKEKSNSLVAVSTFGFQILQYPHFAELCWVTSKLKEGPSANITGPWRGWPFNSCVVRPSNSTEQAVVTPRSGNVKGKESSGIVRGLKESSGIVRGLVAIGLSAYRGIFTSPQEVSFEVRKVLELLVGQINTKIQAGKDSYQYVRLLSQVAYLEDMVNSWAYAMRSLELGSQTDLTGPKLTHIDDVPVQNEEPKSTVSGKTVPDSKWSEEHTKQGTQNIDHMRLNNKDGDFISNSENGLAYLNGGGLVQGIPLYGVPADSRLTIDITKVQTRMSLDPRDSKNTETLPATQKSDCLLFKKEDDDLVSNSEEKVDDQAKGSPGQILLNLKSSSPANEVDGPDHGFSELETIDLLDNRDVSEKSVALDSNVRGSKELAGLRRADSGEACNSNEVSPSVNKSDEPLKQVEDMNSSSTTDTCHADDTSAVCLYHCCPRCISDLQALMLKLIAREWDSKGSDITVEDVHDAVASLSMDLLSVVRKVGVARNSSNTQGANLNLGTLSKCPCKNQVDNLMMPVECGCHSQEINIKETSESTNPWLRCNLDFTFRDGLLVPLDSIKDQASHCKFDAFCLCSLVESIETGMWPID